MRNLLWRLIKKKVEEAVKWQVSLEMAKRERILETQLDNYRNAVKETEKLVGKYAKVFKGFESPSQYMNFIVQTHPSLLRDLHRQLMMEMQLRGDEVVSYVDNAIKFDENQEYDLWDYEMFILGAIAFKTKVTGDITIWRGHRIQTVFKQAAVKESWLPIFTYSVGSTIIFRPLEMIAIDSPSEPILYVIKAERRGRTIC